MNRKSLITLFFSLLSLTLIPTHHAFSADVSPDSELTPQDHFDPSPRPPSTPWDPTPDHHSCYPGHHHPGYPQPGYPQPGYPQPGYPQPGYPQPGYPQPGYPQPGYPQPGYPQPGYPGAPGYFICYARSWRGYVYEGRANYRNYAQNAALTSCYQSGAGQCQLTSCTPW
jgi:hypothetical protein